MDIATLTIGDIQRLQNIFTGIGEVKAHPLTGRRVLAILPHGFIYYGTLKQDGEWLTLTGASNLRYWKSRSGGLPEFAANGPIDDDLIDPCADLTFQGHVALLPLGEWHE